MSRSLKNQVAILTAGRVFAYAVMFFVPLINVRTLSVEEYGFYRQWWLLFETMSPILILGFPRSLLYYLPRTDSNRDRSTYVTQTVVYLAVASIAAWGVYAILGQVLGQGIGLLVRTYFLWLCGFTFFTMVTHYMDSLFVAERKVVQQSVYYAVTATAQALTVIIVSWTTRDVAKLFLALTIFSLVKFVFVMLYTGVEYRPSLRLISLRSIRDQLSYAVPMGLAAIALILLGQTDKFIINRFMGREAFAVYAIGAFQLPFVGILRRSITNVTFPMLAKYHKEGDYAAMLDLWQRATVRTVVMFLPIFIFLEITARPFIELLFTEVYADAVPVFAIYLLLFLRSSVESGNILQAFKKTGYIFRVFAIGFVLNLILSLVMYRVMGRLGVPLSTVIVMYAVHTVNLYNASRLLDVSFFQLLPWVKLLERVGVAMVPGVLFWLLHRARPIEDFLTFGLYGVLFFGAYLGLCAAFGYITFDDIKSTFGMKPDDPAR